ncbi:hypothetical protein HDU93_000185 [Gonapodya sp. JEL0774]|nr:hypothetical protein HDU93_000185 [Gonapodya sp. JEL0774]
MALKVAKIPFTGIRMDTKTHKIVETGEDYYAVAPKGAVPAMLVDGELLTENAAVLQYIADLAPEANLIPPAGTFARYRVQEALSEVGVDLHKAAFGPLFNPALQGEAREQQVARAHTILKRFDKKLGASKFLTGDAVTVADFYAAVCFGWNNFLGISYAEYPNITRFQSDFAALPGIAEAKAEWLAGGVKA